MDAKHNENTKPVREPDNRRTGSFCARKTLVVGLTGGVATGKSTVAAMLKNLGAKVVSADDIVHELLKPGTDVWRDVVCEFGKEILSKDQTIDRKKVGEIVFRASEKRTRLEAIIHPHVFQRIREEIKHFRAEGEGILVLEIPLLVETSSTGLVDKVLVVCAEQETQIYRLQKRSYISREEAVQRIKSQLPMPEKLKHADWVVSTDGTLSSTKEQVDRVWRDIQKSLAQHN